MFIEGVMLIIYSASNFVFIRVISKVQILSGFRVIYSLLGINILSANMLQFFINFVNSFFGKLLRFCANYSVTLENFVSLWRNLGWNVKYNVVLLKGRVND